MPAKAQWLCDIPAILDELRAVDVPVVDRAGCERIFGLRRRRTIQLMNQFGGYRSGNTILLDRMELIRRLEAITAGPELEQEQRRKERLSEKLENLRRYRAAAAVRIPVVPAPRHALPEGVSFARGRMIVSFAGDVEELLGILYAVSQSAAADFETFRAAAECISETTSPVQAK